MRRADPLRLTHQSNPKRSRLARLLLCLIVSVLMAGPYAAAPAQAQTYSDKRLTIVVPIPPGGLVDAIARALGEWFARAWSATVVVENKPGGNFQVGLNHVVKSAPDGHTLLVAMDGPFVINPVLYSKLSYDPVNDFAPIASLVRYDLVLAAHPSVQAANVKDFIELARARNGGLTYGSFGLGSTANLYMLMLAQADGVKMTPVHYQGVAPMITDVVGGHVPAMFATIGQTLPLANDGKLKVLGVGTPQRSSYFPNVPTIAESGAPGFRSDVWFGLFGPRGTPTAIIHKIEAEVRRALSDTAFQERFLKPGFGEPMPSATPEAFAAFIKADLDRWTQLIRAAGIKAE